MARPMILIKETLLRKLWLANEEGVPLSKLLRKHNIPVSAPTLAKLVNFMAMADNTEIDIKLQNIIKASVFPEWLAIEAGSIAIQPENWHYRGKMPFGYWEWSKPAAKVEA